MRRKAVCFGIVIVVYLLLAANAVFAKVLVKEGVIINYLIDDERTGRYVFEITNSNRNDVEVVLHIYSTVIGKIFENIFCNKDYLQTFHIKAKETLNTVEIGCEPERFGKYESEVGLVAVKILAPPQDTLEEFVEGTEIPEAETEGTEIPEEEPDTAVEERVVDDISEAPEQSEESVQAEGIERSPSGQPEPTPTPETPVVEESPTPSEREKMVTEIQRVLTDLGYEPGPIDGRLGNKTISTIKEFQQARNLPVDGRPSDELLLVMTDAFEHPEQQAAVEYENVEDALVQEEIAPISQETTLEHEERLFVPALDEETSEDAQVVEESEEPATPSDKEEGVEVTEQPVMSHITIGVVLDGESESTPQFVHILREKAVNVLGEEYEVSIPDEYVLTGNWTRQQVVSNLDRLLNEPAVDFIVAYGVIASHEAVHHGKLNKPVLSAIVIDDRLQDFPRADLGSGVKNVNYMILTPNVREGLKAFRELVPFEHVALFVDQVYTEAIPEIERHFENISFGGTDDQFTVSVIPVKDLNFGVFAGLPPETEAVYMLPFLRFSETELAEFFMLLSNNGLPTFSHLGKSEVELGALAAIAPKHAQQELAQQVVVNIHRILLGEKAADLPVDVQQRTAKQLTINMATARALHFNPKYSILSDAELLYQETEVVERTLSLFDVVNTARKNNLELIRKEKEIEIGEQEAARIKADRWPQIGLSADIEMLDQNRATSVTGQAERTFSGTFSVTQLLYSNRFNADVAIQEGRQQQSEDDLKQSRSDITQIAAMAYFNVLRAKSHVEIQQKHSNVTKALIELAKGRQSARRAGPGEIYRWDVELAAGRQNMLDAEDRLKLAEMAVNQLLHHPQEEPFTTAEASLAAPGLLLDSMPFLAYLENPEQFEQFRHYMVEVGKTHSDELTRIDAEIATQERVLASLRGESYIPTVTFEMDVTPYFIKNGEGSESVSKSDMSPELGEIIGETPSDVNWSMGVHASFPLFTGGRKRAELAQARLKLEQLQLQRLSAEEHLEQQIRSTVFSIGNAYAKIQLMKDAALAAAKRLDLVTEAYSQGAVSIIEVVDAKHIALQADLAVVETTMDFLADVLRSQRTANRFDFLLPVEEQNRIIQEFEDYLNQ